MRFKMPILKYVHFRKYKFLNFKKKIGYNLMDLYWSVNKWSWAENFRMGDIGINAWSFLFDNLTINIILQDYLKSVWKTIKFKLIFNHLGNCSSQSDKSGQPMERTEIFSLVKTINGYPRREKKSGLSSKMKSFHSGYSDQEVRIKVYSF